MTYNKEYYEQNKEDIIAKAKENYQLHRDERIKKMRLYNKIYYIEHREKIRENQKEHREAKPKKERIQKPKRVKACPQEKKAFFLKNIPEKQLKNIEEKPQVIFQHGNFVVSFD